MRPSEALQTHRDAIREIALRHWVIKTLCRHTGRDCRYPEHRDVNLFTIRSFWVPAIFAGTTIRAFDITKHHAICGEL